MGFFIILILGKIDYYTQKTEGNIDTEYQKDKGIIIMNANETTGSIGRM